MIRLLAYVHGRRHKGNIFIRSMEYTDIKVFHLTIQDPNTPNTLAH